MRANLWAGMMAILLTVGASQGWSQRGVINYEDLSQRNTRSTDRDEKKKEEAKKAADAKRKAEEQKKRDERQKEYESRRNKDNKDEKKPTATTSASGRTTTGTRTAPQAPGARSAGAKSAPKTRNAGGTTDPTAREVTEVMLDAVRTQSVNFDVEAAENDPGIIMLNAPKFDPKDRARAGDAGIAQPL